PALEQLVETGHYGTFHIVNQGACSRFEFAQAVLRQAGRGEYPLQPIALADFKRDSSVPPRTPLHNIAAAALGITLRPWQAALEEFVEGLRAKG
ncbi:MAG: sugar nucleotide-binding protein, partial [Roseiflexaceae bacterium]|nr:sugar nucleotide-binding protein [Roseiflexaceae bacterium]